MNSKKILSALFLGAGIGLVAGVLLAPDKGSETLKKLSNGAKDRFSRLKGDAEDIADNLESEGKTLLDKGTNFAKNYKKDGEAKLSDLQNKFS